LIEGAGPGSPDVSIESTDQYAIMYTSGTTGRPKGVVHSHRDETYHNMLYAGRIGLDFTDVGVSVMPLYHNAELDCELLARINVGATSVILHDFDARRVLEVGRVDATVNHLGGPFSEVGLNVLRRGGRMVVCGQTAGPTSELTLDDLFLNQKRVIGSTMGTQTDLERLVDLIEDGRLEPVVHERYALEETDRAFADMADRNAVGKLVVAP